MTKRTEEEEENNAVLSMTVVASEKQREKLKKENEELVETNTFLIEDLRRREVQLNTVQEELEKYKALYKREAGQGDPRGHYTQSQDGHGSKRTSIY